jgi:hypothetical protein
MGELTRLRINTSWMPARFVAFLCRLAVAAVRGAAAVRRLAIAFVIGAIPAVVLLVFPVLLWRSLDGSGWVQAFFTAVLVLDFLLFAVLIGSALTRLSPVEHDEGGHTGQQAMVADVSVHQPAP